MNGHKHACSHPVGIHVLRLASLPQYEFSRSKQNYLNLNAVCKPEQYLYQYLTNLIYKICFTISFISCLYMFRAHTLIIRRSKFYYTASGIITPIGVEA